MAKRKWRSLTKAYEAEVVHLACRGGESISAIANG